MKTKSKSAAALIKVGPGLQWRIDALFPSRHLLKEMSDWLSDCATKQLGVFTQEIGW